MRIILIYVYTRSDLITNGKYSHCDVNRGGTRALARDYSPARFPYKRITLVDLWPQLRGGRSFNGLAYAIVLENAACVNKQRLDPDADSLLFGDRAVGPARFIDQRP